MPQFSIFILVGQRNTIDYWKSVMSLLQLQQFVRSLLQKIPKKFETLHTSVEVYTPIPNHLGLYIITFYDNPRL